MIDAESDLTALRNLYGGAQGHNNALGVLALVARATGQSLGRDIYGRTGRGSAQGKKI